MTFFVKYDKITKKDIDFCRDVENQSFSPSQAEEFSALASDERYPKTKEETDMRKIIIGADSAGYEYKVELISYLTEKGYSITYGARNLQRLIQKEVEDAIATEIIDRRQGAVSRVALSVHEGRVQVLAI